MMSNFLLRAALGKLVISRIELRKLSDIKDVLLLSFGNQRSRDIFAKPLHAGDCYTTYRTKKEIIKMICTKIIEI